jgi:hypothetical protein
MMNIRIKVLPLGKGRVAVSTINTDTNTPLEDAFTGPHYAGAIERNARCARWSNMQYDEKTNTHYVPDSVVGDAMPVMF